MTHHFIEKCRHGDIVAQCRCPGPKTERIVECEHPAIAAPTKTAEEIIAGAIECLDRPKAQWIVAELERYGFVIVKPSDSPAQPFEAAYSGHGPLMLIEANAEVIRYSDAAIPAFGASTEGDWDAYRDALPAGRNIVET